MPHCNFSPKGQLLSWLALVSCLTTGCAARQPVSGVCLPASSAQGGCSDFAGADQSCLRRFFNAIYTTGATGPGIDYSAREPFLGGALLPETGWPTVFFDHFVPRHGRLCNLWIVQTRDCPQELGSDPWPCLKVLSLEEGRPTVRDPRDLFAQVKGRPVLIQVLGNLTTPDVALGALLWTHTWLRCHGALAEDTVVIAFDWPSDRVRPVGIIDVHEKSRRAFVAGYHLARFVEAFPSGSRICLLGHSYGGKVVPSALHLLGGGSLSSKQDKATVCLQEPRPDLHLRGVVSAGASDRHWILPGERLGHALKGAEALLVLYNTQDRAILGYPLLLNSDHRRALGQTGLSPGDLQRLGPLAERYAQYDMTKHFGKEHTLLRAVADPEIARRIAPYTWACESPFTPTGVKQISEFTPGKMDKME